MRTKKMLIAGLLFVIAAILSLVAFNLWQIKYGGTPVPVPTIPRQPTTYGTGKPLNYVIMGDSTAVSQGSQYQEGYAVATAHELAKSYQVTMTNFAVSGARTHDVLTAQLLPVVPLKPDLILIAIGANDVTHNTSASSVRADITKTVDALTAANCNVKIVLTGAAAMGTVPRLAQPLRFFAGQKAASLNKVFRSVAETKSLTFVAIADKTGPTFAADSSLFAQDKFHPNAEGYAVWVEALIPSLHEALDTQPSHCNS